MSGARVSSNPVIVMDWPERVSRSLLSRERLDSVLSGQLDTKQYLESEAIGRMFPTPESFPNDEFWEEPDYSNREGLEQSLAKMMKFLFIRTQT